MILEHIKKKNLKRVHMLAVRAVQDKKLMNQHHPLVAKRLKSQDSIKDSKNQIKVAASSLITVICECFTSNQFNFVPCCTCHIKNLMLFVI